MNSVRHALAEYQPHQPCHTKTLRAIITRRGHKQFAIWCNCGPTPQRGTFIPHRIVKRHVHTKGLTIDDIPLDHINACFNCYGTGCEFCEKKPCVRCGSFRYLEVHHWAPRHLFPDADLWPTSLLCRTCHQHWHRTVTPNMNQRTTQ